MNFTQASFKRIRHFFPWPKKLLGQMIVLMLLALLLAQGISLWVLSNAHRKAIEGHNQRFMLRQLSSMVLLLESTPADLHPKILSAWRRPGVSFKLSVKPQVEKPITQEEKLLASQMEKWLGDAYTDRVHVTLKVAAPPSSPPPPLSQFNNHRHDWRGKDLKKSQGKFRPRRQLVPLEQLVVAIPLSDDRWLQSKAVAPSISPLTAQHTIIFVLISSVLVLLVLVWRLRKITRPLAQLAEAANALGRGQKVATLPEQGPEDIKSTIGAFNRMNERLERFVSDRTRMLAALSHDLRTPITSMRLRLEMMVPGTERDQLLASLDEMQQMSEATLAFIREGGDVESTRSVDIAALVSSVCDDLADMGAAVSYEYEGEQVLACRPVSLKRALRNLIENAIKYGDSARVTLEQRGDLTLITIQDQGPGIPEELLSKVFEPFFRIESSRSRNTGGIGLGLSIAQQIINSHGGEVQLQTTHEGLQVVISLPGR